MTGGCLGTLGKWSMQPTLASTFPSAAAFAASCVLLAAIPLLMLAWVFVQVRFIATSQRMPWWVLAFVILFMPLPLGVAFEWLTAHGKLTVYWDLAAWTSMIGLALFVVTVLFEATKLVRELRTASMLRDKSDRLRS